MSRLAIFLLGAPRIELDGQPVETDTRKASALLAFLAVTGRLAAATRWRRCFTPTPIRHTHAPRCDARCPA